MCILLLQGTVCNLNASFIYYLALVKLCVLSERAFCVCILVCARGMYCEREECGVACAHTCSASFVVFGSVLLLA